MTEQSPDPARPGGPRRARRPRRWVAPAALVAATVLVVGGVVALRHTDTVEQAAVAAQQAVAPRDAGTFPAVDESALTPQQRRFLQVVRAQHQAPQPGTFYSQGPDEPWCGDFVSWVARESGAPLTNPNSGGWRVPGVFTLQESLQAAGTWHAADSGYTPKLGDIVIYRVPGSFGDHTNYVLSYAGGRLTTVGGNEPGGVAVSTHTVDPALGVWGYGER